MAKKDETRQPFRPADAQLDAEIEQALSGMSIDDMLMTDAPSYAPPAESVGSAKGQNRRTGRVIRVTPDDIYLDFGGKAQGVAPREAFEEDVVVDQTLEVEVERYDPGEGMLICTRPGAAAKNISWENLEVGTTVEGTVTGSNKGGLELEVKGMRAFMPAGQVEMFHVPNFEDYVGQRMTAEVTQVDAQRKNLILSRRNILEREREEQKQKTMAELAEGQVRRGTVRSVMDYGAFVDIGGVEGLLHVSELSYRRQRISAKEFIKEGEVLDVKVIKIDPETGKIGLSLKQALGEDPWVDAERKYAPGMQVTGRVTKLESFGAFVEVEEGIEGLLPVSEMSWQRIKHPSDLLKEGDTIKLVVLQMDAEGHKISFSLKQAGPDPWKTVGERYAQEMVVEGTVSRVVDFGAFVELEPGLEGLVHISELANQRVRSPGDVVKPGETVKVRVLEIDAEARRISLSLKRADEPTAAEIAATPAPQPKKKKTHLRGGLDW